MASYWDYEAFYDKLRKAGIKDIHQHIRTKGWTVPGERVEFHDWTRFNSARDALEKKETR
jgi:hypothetical protein